MKVAWKYFLISGLVVSLILAFFISPFASSYPDGLEKVATNHGFIEKGERNVWNHSPIADYLFPGVKSEFLAKGLAGLVGTLVVFILSYGIVTAVRKLSVGSVSSSGSASNDKSDNLNAGKPGSSNYGG